MTLRICLSGYDQRDSNSHHLVKRVNAPSMRSFWDGVDRYGLDGILESRPVPVDPLPMDDADLAFDRDGNALLGNPVALFVESREFTTCK